MPEFISGASFGDGTLKPFLDSLWTAASPIRFALTWFPHVMTVIRLKNGSIILHSPCRPSAVLFEEIARIGAVAHVVAPNWFHDLYLREYRAVFPDATFWGPPFLRRQHPAIIDDVLDDAVIAPWKDELAYASLSGLLSFDEIVFFHVSTRTLIMGDFLMSVGADQNMPMLTRLGYRMFGLHGQLKIFPILRWFGLTSRASMRRVANQIIAWNPTHVIVGHGRPSTRDRSHELRRALSALLVTK